MARIAVFGGTFNPFHIGHYEILSALCESDMFDRVLLIPDKIPPHKDFYKTVTDDDRIAMCRLACDDFSKAVLCLIEFERDGKSYTVDTITALKKIYPNDELFVACGGDMIETLDTWHRFDKLKAMVKFVAFKRSDDKSFRESVEKMRLLGARIMVFDKEITEISSSKLRENIDKRYLPKKVWDYVSKRGIYKQ